MSEHPLTLPVPVEWHCAITDYAAVLRAGAAAESTVATRVSHLRTLARRCGVASPAALSGDALVLWCGRQSWSVETRRSFRASAVGFFGWLARTGRAAGDAGAALPPVTPAPPAPRPTPELVYSHALHRADGRTALILRLAAEAGLRRGEIARVATGDVLDDLVGRSLVVHGKGGRRRVVPLTDSVAAAIVAGAAGHTAGGATAGYVFPGDDDGHLSPRYVGTLAGRALPAGWTLHTLRHRFASRAYAAGRDAFAVQQLLGHASPVTTLRYVVVPPEHLRATVNAVSERRLHVQ